MWPNSAVVFYEAEDDGVKPEVREELFGSWIGSLENLAVDTTNRNSDDGNEDTYGRFVPLKNLSFVQHNFGEKFYDVKVK